MSADLRACPFPGQRASPVKSGVGRLPCPPVYRRQRMGESVAVARSHYGADEGEGGSQGSSGRNVWMLGKLVHRK